MTLDDWYNQNVGKSLLVPGEPASERGQCVQAADFVLHDVYGFPYHYGNAIDWWNSPGDLLTHFDKITDGSIKKGDFVIFNTLVGSQFGHIDVAMADGNTSFFVGADSNWGGNLTVHQVQHNNASYVLGSLRLKQEDDMPNDGDVDNAYLQGNNRKATDQEKAVYTSKPWSAPDGLYYGKIRVDFDNTLKALGAAQNASYEPYSPPPLFTKK